MQQRIKQLSLAMFFAAVGLLLCLGMPHKVAAYDWPIGSSVWGTTTNPWQIGAPDWKTTLVNTQAQQLTDDPDGYNYQMIWSGTAADFYNFNSGDTTPLITGSTIGARIPTTTVDGKPANNVDATVPPTITVVSGSGTSQTTQTDSGLPGGTIGEDITGTYSYFNISSSSNDFPQKWPSGLAPETPLSVTVKLKLKQPDNITSPAPFQFVCNNRSSIMPYIYKAFYQDDTTGADLAPAEKLGVGGTVNSGPYIPALKTFSADYKFDSIQVTTMKINPSDGTDSALGGSVVNLTMDRLNTLANQLLKLQNYTKKAIFFWYEPKDPSVKVYYKNDTTGAMIAAADLPSSVPQSAWGYIKNSIYQAGTDTEDPANYLTAPTDFTAAGKKYTFTDKYDYYSAYNNGAGAVTASGTNITAQKLAGVIGDQAVVFHYQAQAESNFGVHYWDADKQATTVPTSNQMTADDGTDVSAGDDAFKQLTGDPDTAVTLDTTDPIDGQPAGTAGIGAPNPAEGYYYLGYKYNDGSGTTKWVPYDPDDATTTRFTGDFNDSSQQGLTFLYRKKDSLSLTVPSELNFGTAGLPISSAIDSYLKYSSDGTIQSTDKAVVDVDDERVAGNDNDNSAYWNITLQGAPLAGSSATLTNATISFNNGAEAIDNGTTIEPAINLPLDGNSTVMVAQSTGNLGKDSSIEWASQNVRLKIPLNSTAVPDSYHSMLTWTLTYGY
ncbi:WxL domain-containing protein [Loigolactobacillus binensis]|uniref:WxL domain-containing protein n=1 Tax=Loigolactobacillus binensis TaxID=2559922 RepID=A0ABW3EFV5_9LACO|nr:WxL domain-containing protein [Loigolactobacillus binensis]